jgi:DNA-binding NtrC family response regulator
MTHRYRAAVVDDEAIVCDRLKPVLEQEGLETETFCAGMPFLKQMEESPFHLVFLDLNLPDIHGMKILSTLTERYEHVEIIVITGHGSIDSVVEAMKNSAFHYLTKPFKLSQIAALIRSALEKFELREENRRLHDALIHKDAPSDMIIGVSSAMREVLDTVKKVSAVDCNVLLQGDSGTGKELVARAVHRISPRQHKPFVPFNCAAFTEELICSELFGHKKGAFTGASHTKIGLLESAAGGSVFLDEIGEMPLSMQVKLLRAIQEKSILRVGGTTPIDIDIRIIAASNKDLKKASQNGDFREDLFYRLNVVTIHLPQLTERKEDIPLFVSAFINRYNQYFGKTVGGISSQAMEILKHYHYPGNVRELENIIQRAVALTSGNKIQVKDLPPDLQQLEFSMIEGEGLLSMAEIERQHIQTVLKKTDNNKQLAAKILNIPRTTLWRKMKKFGLISP